MAPNALCHYRYQCMTPNGRRISGFIWAENEEKARFLLQKEDKILLRLKTVKSSFFPKDRYLSSPALALVFQGLGQLLCAGIPLAQALDIMIPTYTKIDLSLLVALIRQGKPLSQALVTAHLVKTGFVLSLVKGAETTGQYGTAIQEAALYLQWKQDLRSSLIKSLSYPLFLIIISLGLFVFLFSVVMPKLTDLYLVSAQAVPESTRLLMLIADYVPLIIKSIMGGLMVMVIGAGTVWVSRNKMPYVFGRMIQMLLAVPLVGRVLKDMACVCFCKSLEKLLKSNHQSVLHSLEDAIQTIHPSWLRPWMARVPVLVQKGKPLSWTLARTDLFQDWPLQLIRVAEETGRLHENFEKISAVIEKQLRARIDEFANKLGPIMIVGVGIILMIIVTSVFLPLYDSLGGLE